MRAAGPGAAGRLGVGDRGAATGGENDDRDRRPGKPENGDDRK
jgi:hypothetical protein